jgi:hypothetical protein
MLRRNALTVGVALLFTQGVFALDAPTLLTNGTLTTNGTATASISPSADIPVYACLASAQSEGGGNEGGVSFTVSGAGLTWAAVASSEIFYGGRRHAEIWRGVSASPSSGGITITASNIYGGTFQSTMYALFEADAAIDTADPNTDGVVGAGTGTTATASGLADPGTGGVFSCFINTTAANAMTPGAEAGAELVDFADSAGSPNVRRMMVAYDSTPDSTPVPTATFTSDDWAAMAITLNEGAGGSAPTLSDPTPSGTLGTTTTATIGATSDDSSGDDFYAVVDSAANLDAVTEAQIKAGQNETGAAAVASCSAAVSTTSPSCGVTGLTAATGYSYSAVQDNATGDSNIVTGTFTTAASAAGTPQAMHLQRLMNAH